MDDVGERVKQLVASHPDVVRVDIVGSRARGDASQWSDWDLKVYTDAFDRVADDLPGLVERLDPLAAQWDRLSDNECFTFMTDGPTKVDLLFDVPRTHLPPHEPSPDTLSAIDAHFWDWILWLTSKVGAAKDEVVRTELEKMSDHLLRPMGVPSVPRTLLEAVDRYLGARDQLEDRLRVHVPRELGSQVERVVREQAAGSST
jgi:hypothetical protein